MKARFWSKGAKPIVLAAAFWAALFLPGWPGGGARAAATITNAADILALPSELAVQNIPVHVKGVVTTAETNWSGRFFMADASGGVFVDNRVPLVAPEVGDVVE